MIVRHRALLVTVIVFLALVGVQSQGERLRTGSAQTIPHWAYPWCGNVQPYVSSVFDHDLPVRLPSQDWWRITVYAGPESRRVDCMIPPGIAAGLPDPWMPTPGTPYPDRDPNHVSNHRRCVDQPTPLPITQVSCWRYDGHDGWDYYMPYGEPVYAADDARVSYVGYLPAREGDPPNASGLLIPLSHNDGQFETIYNHLSAALVEQGDYVFKGQRIGTVGRSGLSPSHPHLHFESRVSPGGPNDVFDPYGWESLTPDPWEQVYGVKSIRVFDPGIWQQGQPTPGCDDFGGGGPYPVVNDSCPATCGSPLYADDADPPLVFQCSTCSEQRVGGHPPTAPRYRTMPITAAGSGHYAAWQFCGLAPGSYKVEISIPSSYAGLFPHQARYLVNGNTITVSQFDVSQPRNRGAPWAFDDWLDVGVHAAQANTTWCDPFAPLGIEVRLRDSGGFLAGEESNAAIVDAVRISRVCDGTYKGATPTAVIGPGS